RPDAPLAELSLLNADWRARVASVRRPKPSGVPVVFGSIEQSIPNRFAEQVRLHPERVALRTQGATLNYRELDEAARSLASVVVSLPPSPRVALLLQHDERMIVGLLGVLQAGRAYVPLDAAHPAERLSYILEDTEASVIVCTSALRPLAERLAGNARHVIELDNLTEKPLSELPAVSADSVAYVLYTSGSTGQPKGVIQSHRNVLHFIRQYTENLRLTPEDRLLQVASYAFDAGVMDIFGALLNGATLCPVDLRETGVEGLCERMARDEITIFHSTPTVYRLFVGALRRRLASVRLVVLGGEAVVRSDAEAFRRHFEPGCLFVNGLGPTESTVTLQHFLDHATPLTRFAVPVGRPVGGTEVLLFDEDDTPAELYGEIVIRSAHVALGYWRQESSAFGDDPQTPGKRLYRTGDLGRLLPDGTLEAVGRRDDQIKLRGFRIELGEIEAVLRQHPSVREAAVALWSSNGHHEGGAATEPRLVAYVSGEVRAADLKAYAQQRLPEYMVPAATMVLSALPLTVNGKLDRRSLPPPSFEPDADEKIQTSAEASNRPTTQTEILLANLWGDLLGVDVDETGADFFSLGGHSLLAMQALSRIRDAFGVELPLSILFEQPVLRDLAAEIDASTQAITLPPLKPLAEGEELSLSFAQQRLWFLSQLQPEAADTYTINAALLLEGELDQDALRAALLRLTRRQSSLRLNFRSVEGRPAVSMREPYDPLTIEDLRALPTDEREAAVKERAAAHAREPFDLERDELLRLRLLRTEDERHVLLFSVHHIVADGWSLEVLVRDLSALYTSALEGRAASLPPLAVQYTDYAAWQKEWLRGDVLERQLAYWHEQLRDAPTLLNLPTDYPRPATMSYRGGQSSRTLAGELASRLRSLCRGQDATLYMALMAAFQTLLRRYTGQDEIVVGTPIANRQQSQTEQLVGLFANTLALRTDVSGDPRFVELLARVRAVALGAYAHQ
ncbi:MAG TPA: amino acid adenylation domain-containing protein, partial [Pyrinomonadaceae bacterium]|nr:amino acid adenylation domain-containing protein [Pyrinomonadaceae bacterium]